MGVSGSGKSTVAAALAGRLGCDFVDGDDLHPADNVAKMRAGLPLDDGDRWPWLDRVGARLREGRGGVVLACSALRRRYRDRIRAGAGAEVCFVFLDARSAEVAARLVARRSHFMPASLLDSQFATLERPTRDEVDVIAVATDRAVQDIVGHLVARLRPSGETGA